MSFWRELAEKKQPFFCAAPMADVTDAAFRMLITRYGKPDVMWTEFVSADGLLSPGRAVLKHSLRYDQAERPIVAQLFSGHPEKMEGAARLVAELGFDGLDINMGCPDRAVERQCAGAALIRHPELAREIISAAKRGVSASGRLIPVSVKTRVGYEQVAIASWIGTLLASDIAALTVHARTRREMSKVPAVWDRVDEVVRLRDKLGVDTVVIGNGDIVSLNDGRRRAAETGCEGIMVGRGLLGNPWFFDSDRDVSATLPRRHFLHGVPLIGRLFETRRRAPESARRPMSSRERLQVLVEHTILFKEMLGSVKHFSTMKKHFKAYCLGFPKAKELRLRLMQTSMGSEVVDVVNRFLHTGQID